MPKFAVDSAMSRAVRRMATSRWFRKVAPSIVPPMDRAVHKITKGRVSVSGAIVPNLVLTTIGRKSGEPRPSPLACVPEADDAWFVVGSNFGRETHPLWTANLIANPAATVDYRRQTYSVTAELLDDEAKAEIWPRLVEVWPAYDDYVEASGRSLRVFRLTKT